MKNLILLFLSALCFSVSAAKVDTLDIASPAMGKTYKAAVVLPDSYSKGNSQYPVIYLLHGAYGHFRDWLNSTPDKNVVKNLADTYGFIIVMPEGETFSFYLNSPVNKESQFETYITEEVISKVDKTYRTISNKKGRIITGLSMGGHGALYLSTRHPDLFCAAGSMSGALDMGMTRSPESQERVNKMLIPVFGTEPASQAVLDSHSVVRMVDKIKSNKLDLIIDCGTDDKLIEVNREMHRRLLYAGVPHDYTERPGAHNWEYWDNAIAYQVLFFSKVLKKNAAITK